MMKPKIAILISGRGSNMMAIHRAVLADKIAAEIKFIGCDMADAAGLAYAQKHAIPVVILPYRMGADGKLIKDDAEQILLDQLDDVVLLCLAGFMRILSANFLAQCPCRTINIHPSLLPAFKGLDTHKRVLEAGMRIHGCTIHEVTESLDSGKILAQREITIRPDSDETQLQKQILALEHQLYPEIIAKILEKPKC